MRSILKKKNSESDSGFVEISDDEELIEDQIERQKNKKEFEKIKADNVAKKKAFTQDHYGTRVIFSWRENSKKYKGDSS